ncbi:MAG: FecR domain-containing protein [Saprospiraceae bacterium]|nr:FecR domain-containing protein [Saprospiraceae bacterium]
MQENQYILLLTRQWSGEISREESDMLKSWLEASAENVSTAEAFQAIWESSSEPTVPFNVDVNADFLALQSRLNTAPEASSTMRPILGRLIRAAAAVVLLGGAVWAYRTSFPEMVMNTVVVQDEAVRQLDLSDGTRVWLRQNASITYPETFTGHKRTVSIQGEVYFDVKHDVKHPFQVELPSKGRVEVLGTQFAVNTRDQEPSVLVRSGKVRFHPGGSSRDVILSAYQAAAYYGENKPFVVRNLTSLNELSWQSGGLEFVRTPLARVVEDLEKHYNVSIDLENKNLADCLHTAPLTNQSINNVLASLALTYGLQVKQISPAKYLLLGGSCN